MSVQEWLEAYAWAWQERDRHAAVAFFTEDVVYRSSPLPEPDASSRAATSRTRAGDASSACG